MMHTLEWSRAYTGRLQRDAAAVFAARAPELSRRLETECAQGSLPFLTMPYRERLERELPPLLPRVRARRHMLVLGIGGMVVCSISAIQTGRLRTMIAYSSGAQIGYIYMGLGMGTQAALLAALLQIVAHAVTKPMLFLSGAGLAGASGGHQDFRSLRGAAHRAPAAGVLFTIGALSMVGIPIFAGFIPKLYFATAAAATAGWQVWAVWLALGVSTVLNVLYFLYTAMLIWVPEETEHAQRPKRFSPLPTAGLAAMNLAVGLGSAAVTELFAMGMGLFCG